MTGSPSEQRELRTRRGETLRVGPVAEAEQDALFALFSDVVARGDGYPHAAPLTREVHRSTWETSVTMTVAVRLADALVGAYYLKPNFVGRAAHIANAGYLVDAAHRRRGIGRVLVEDSLWRAPLLGFDAVQFNLVFASNPARRLYEELGWRELGRVPRAVEGQDAIIYFRFLD